MRGVGRSWNRKSQEARLCHRRDSAPSRPGPGGGCGAAEGPGWGFMGEALEGDRGRRDRARAWGGSLRFPPLVLRSEEGLSRNPGEACGSSKARRGLGGPEVALEPGGRSRKGESGGPEVQVWGVKTARFPRKWDGGPETGRGEALGPGTARKWKVGSSSSDNSCGKRGSEEGEAGVTLDRSKGFPFRGDG